MKNKKTTAIVVCALVVLVAILACVFVKFGAKSTAGSKSITIEVVDNNANSTVYEVKTDAEFLRQAMEEADGLEFSGSESDYGMFVETINGVTADYNVDSSYWAFYVNDGYCNYGIDAQPVNDGDKFKIEYTAG